MKRLSLLIMASGNGSNAEAILRLAQEKPELFDVKAVVSDRLGALVLERAKKYGVPTHHIPHGETGALLDLCRSLAVDWVCLAGYLRILPEEFLRAFQDRELGGARVLNVHPSLLPEFKGLRAYERAFSAGIPFSGVTIHLVDAELDHGPIVVQEKLPLVAGESLEEFKARGHKLEHKLYAQALEIVAQGKVSLRRQTG